VWYFEISKKISSHNQNTLMNMFMEVRLRVLRSALFWVVSCMDHMYINGWNAALLTDRAEKHRVRNT
jgi:hypothetical protein